MNLHDLLFYKKVAGGGGGGGGGETPLISGNCERIFGAQSGETINVGDGKHLLATAKLKTQGITNASYMFYKNPFEKLSFKVDLAGATVAYMFQDCSKLTGEIGLTGSISSAVYFANGCSLVNSIQLPKIINNTSFSYAFYNCKELETVEFKNMSEYKVYLPYFYYAFCGANKLKEIKGMENVGGYEYLGQATKCGSFFTNCFSLRKVPQAILEAMDYYDAPVSSSSQNAYASAFSSCFVLDELKNVGVAHKTEGVTTNMFSSTFNMCDRLKSFTFKPGQVAKWKNQTLNFSNAIGYGLDSTNAEKYGIEDANHKVAYDKTTYDAVKNDPDWFSRDPYYSRYNHDSAVETINSLPDTSAYLAEVGGTNTIRFSIYIGRDTDGGACGNLTSEEIAMAAAKGWTVSLS